MSSIEKINEIKKNLEEMKETKQGIKTVLENKFKKQIGDDFTKYPKMINEVWSEHEKINVGEDGSYFFSKPCMFKPIWDFSNTTNFYRMLYNSTPPSEELLEKIEINLRNLINYDNMFRVSSSDNTYNPLDHFKIVGLPTNTNNVTDIIDNLFSYLDNVKHLDNIFELDEELDLKGRVFQLINLWQYSQIENMKHLPNWFIKICGYTNSFVNINPNSKTINLDEDINLELCKEKDLSYNSNNGGWFKNFNVPNIHLYLNHNYTFNLGYSLFMCGSCPGLFKVDGPGCMIFTNDYTYNCPNKFGDGEFKGNKLEIKFKLSNPNTMKMDQDFSNFKDVRFLEGTEFYSVSNLPYTTREEWIDFFNSLPDNSSSTYQNTIKINSDYYNLLTEDDILISTNKGYIITSV